MDVRLPVVNVLVVPSAVRTWLELQFISRNQPLIEGPLNHFWLTTLDSLSVSSNFTELLMPSFTDPNTLPVLVSLMRPISFSPGRVHLTLENCQFPSLFTRLFDFANFQYWAVIWQYGLWGYWILRIGLKGASEVFKNNSFERQLFSSSQKKNTSNWNHDLILMLCIVFY